MTSLVIAGLTLAAMAAVGYPLAVRRPEVADEAIGDGDETQDLTERKDSIYGDLRDLELDRRTGKVAEDDYEAMRTDYEVEAARVLQSMDRGAKGNNHDLNGHEIRRCAGCGTEAPEGARFCPDCGHSLAPACPACGAMVGVEHRFCGGCGQEVTLPGNDREGGNPS